MSYKTGQVINDEFLLLKSSIEETKRGKKYIRFSVRDRHGAEIEQCKRWDCDSPPQWKVVHIVGKIDEYQGQKHIIATRWEMGKTPVETFSPKAPWKLVGELLLEKFVGGLDLIRNEELRKWIHDFIFHWEKNGFPDGENGVNIVLAPAAITVHHAYQYGWIEHTLEVVDICAKIKSFYEKSVITQREGDLLIAGAFIHDIGKLFQFSCRDGIYEFSHLCKVYGWHSNAEQIIGSNMLLSYCAKEGYPPGKFDTLYPFINMIISHHGNQYSIGNSTYIISRLLHFADHISADVNRMYKNLSTKEEVERDKVHENYMRI